LSRFFRTRMNILLLGTIFIVILLLGLWTIEPRENDTNRIDKRPNSQVDFDSPGKCGGCHDGFEPFALTPTSDNGLISIEVSNKGEHKVLDLEAKMMNVEGGNVEPFHDSFSGTLGFSGTSTHGFPVESGAISATVILDADQGIIGLNNVDLYLSSSEGDTWSSTGSGGHEEISLGPKDLESTGKYMIEVRVIQGVRVSYTVTVDVIYGSSEVNQKGEDLDPGGSFNFQWENILQEGIIEADVSGDAFHDHSGSDDHDRERYSVEVSFSEDDIQIRTGLTEDGSSTLGIGRAMGILSLVIFSSTIFVGFGIKRWTLKEGTLDLSKVHCYLTLGLLIFAILHGSILLTGFYKGTYTGLALGATAILIILILFYTGKFEKMFTKSYGKRSWKNIHRFLTVAVLLIVLFHAFSVGYHFQL